MSAAHTDATAEEQARDEAQWRASLMAAYTRFHELGLKRHGSFPGLVSFAMADAAFQANGSFHWSWSVPSALRETISGINAWASRLHEWALWIELLPEYDEDTRWELKYHFVEHVAFFAMYQPRAVAERILEVAETALHHANCFTLPDYKDRLDQDYLKQGARFTVRQRRVQVDRLGAHWKTYRRFRDLWTQIDSDTYRKLSRDFRNLTSHSIGPRFNTGEILRAHRFPLLISVSYEFISVKPLPFETAYKANRQEFQRTKKCMDALSLLINELIEAINNRHAEISANAVNNSSVPPK